MACHINLIIFSFYQVRGLQCKKHANCDFDVPLCKKIQAILFVV